MIVHDLNLNSIRLGPVEADPPPVVNANTVLSYPIATESFQPVTRDRSQIGNDHGRIHLIELSLRHCGNALELPAELPPEDPLGLFVPERPDHRDLV